MSGRGRRVDPRIAHTVACLLRCPRSSVPEAMQACKFTLDESENRSKQMTIRRSLAAQKATVKEKNKTGGLSSLQIEAKVKKEFDGIVPHTATIRCYINANIAGMSPLKIGVKGDVPACAFIQQINSRQGEITYKKLVARINALLGHNYRQKMLQRILLATAKNLDLSTMHIA